MFLSTGCGVNSWYEDQRRRWVSSQVMTQGVISAGNLLRLVVHHLGVVSTMGRVPLFPLTHSAYGCRWSSYPLDQMVGSSNNVPLLALLDFSLYAFSCSSCVYMCHLFQSFISTVK